MSGPVAPPPEDEEPPDPAIDFTGDEIAILQAWLGRIDLNGPARGADGLRVDAALQARGFRDPAPPPYTRHQAAVGTILMEPVRDRQGHRGRPYEIPAGSRDEMLRRRAARSGLPRFGGVGHLFSVLWERPVDDEQVRHDYACVWAPAFDRMVVVESLGLPSDLPYADFAIAHWQPGTGVESPFERAIKAHWSLQPDWMDRAWEMYVTPGDVAEDEAYQWAEDVWKVEGAVLPWKGVRQ